MKKLAKGFVGAMALTGSLFLAGCADPAQESGNNGATGEGNVLYFLPIIETGAYWANIVAGAESMAAELGFDIVVRSAPSSDPQRNERQIAFVREGISENAAAIGLAPRDPDMLDRVAEEARDAGVPLITFDSDVATVANRLSYVGTDNFTAGEYLGANAAELMMAQGITEGSIALAATNLTQSTFVQRMEGIREGFEAAMGANAANFTWLEPIADDDQSAESQRQMEAQIVANQDMVAVFSLGSEGPTTGIMGALRSQNRGGEILHFGFDYTDTWLTGVEAGLITAIVNQDAFEIGRRAIQTMVDLAEGREVNDYYAVAVTWVLAEDIEAHGQAILARMGE